MYKRVKLFSCFCDWERGGLREYCRITQIKTSGLVWRAKPDLDSQNSLFLLREWKTRVRVRVWRAKPDLDSQNSLFLFYYSARVEDACTRKLY